MDIPAAGGTLCLVSRQAVGDAANIWSDLQKIGGFTRYEWESVDNPRGGEWRTGDQGGEIDYYDAYGRSWTELYRYTGN